MAKLGHVFWMPALNEGNGYCQKCEKSNCYHKKYIMNENEANLYALT